MIYLTYNDLPSGIYYGQVTDVCNFLNKEFKVNIRLVALISLRNYFTNRKKIKTECNNAIVLPIFPKVRNWKLNLLSLFFIFPLLNSKKVIARGPFAASMALTLKKRGFVRWICYDGRGAAAAEMNEYNVTDDEKVKRKIYELEKKSILNSDFRIAVSHALVNYWKETFGYSEEQHVVIPCTLNSKYFSVLPDENTIKENRKKLGFSESDIIIVYSGSSAGWQSLKMADDFLLHQMQRNQNIKALFLLKKIPTGMKIKNEFQDRIVCKWLKEQEVPDVLSCGDYGLLLREKSITNKVASPVKFAEYLAAGLKVILSEEIGDYSDFSRKNNCGLVADNSLSLTRVSYEERKSCRLLAIENFSKKSFREQYIKLVK